MQIQLTESLKSVFIKTSKALCGCERRLFMARVVLVLGPGGQRLAETELGWNRGTIRNVCENSPVVSVVMMPLRTEVGGALKNDCLIC